MNSLGYFSALLRSRFSHSLLTSIALVLSAHAQGNIVYALKAVNPAQTDSTVIVSAPLPKGIKPGDVVDSGGMEVKYDAINGLYRIRGEEKLTAGGNKEYRVVLRDIWTVPQEKIAELRIHAARLVELLAKTPRKETAVAVKNQIDTGLARLESWQTKYRLGPNTTPAAHIQAYGRSELILKEAVEDVGVLENQARGEGIDLAKAFGPPPPLRDRETGAAGGKPGVIRISVRNTGRTERKMPIKEYLPRDVRQDDVTADDRLDVRYDTERSACYVFSDGITIKPDETINFEVRVADRWIVGDERYSYLKTKTTNVQARAEEWKKEDVKGEAQQLLNRIAAVQATERPPFGEDYIASYHKQESDLNQIEEEILRLEARLTPSQERRIFEATMLNRVEAPSRSTTWIIVYITLGFLMLVSLLFFLRWYGKSRDETMQG